MSPCGWSRVTSTWAVMSSAEDRQKPSKLSRRRSLAAQGGGKLRVGLCLTLILAVRIWSSIQFLSVEGSLQNLQDFGEVSQQRGNIYKGT